MPADIASEMRAARSRLGLSQERLARALGLTRVTVLRIEQGKAAAHPTLLRLALRALLYEHEAREAA